MTDERIRAHARKLPLVLINRDIEGIPRVLIDSSAGVRQAVDHLATSGHRRIAYASGPAASWSNKQQRAAIQAGATAHQMELSIVPTLAPTYQAGREAVPAILETGATGAVAFDDLTAQCILTGLAERRIVVPRTSA